MTAFLLAALLSLPAAAETVVLRTNFGDLRAVLKCDAAPRRCERFLSAVRAGSYDGVPAAGVDPARMIRFKGVDGGGYAPGAPAPALPAEPGGLPHRYGTLTYARPASQPDPTGTAFSIMVAAVPAMDGKFTSFGFVSGGGDVLELIRALPLGPDGAPVETVRIEKAWVEGESAAPSASRGLLAVAAALAIAGLFLTAAGSRRKNLKLTAAGLLALLAGFFAAFSALLPAASSSAWLGIVLLAAAVAVFRLMGRFEKA